MKVAPKIASLFIILMAANSSPAFAGGVGKVFDYYEIAFNSLIEAGDRAAVAEFSKMISDIEQKIEVIQSTDIGSTMRGNPNYIKSLVDGVLGTNTDLNTGGHGYLYNWGTVSNGLKTAVSAKGVIDIANTLKDIGVSTKKFNNIAKEIAELSARGNADTIEWLIAVSSAGYYGSSALNNLAGLGDESKVTLDLLLQNRNLGEIGMIATALQQDSASYAVSEYKDLMLDEDGKRVIVQQLVIRYLNGPDGFGLIDDDEDLNDQNLYGVKFVDRWWPFRNAYEGTVVSGSELYPNIKLGDDPDWNIGYIDDPVYLASPEGEEPLVSIYLEAPNSDLIDEIKVDVPEDAPDTLPTWTGSASMVGRAADFSPHYRPHGLRANGKAPSNNTVIFEPEYGQISAPIIGTQNGRNIDHSYQHLIWGNWSGGNRTFVRGIDGVTVNNLSGFFVYGEAMPQGARSGTATYTGQVLGDLVRGADQSIARGVVHGTLGITANLGSGTLGGWLALNKDGATSPWVVADINNASISVSEGVTGFNGSLVGSNGENGNLSGNFFGATGSELGGSYWLNGVDDTSGIFLGYDTPTMPVRPPNPVVVVPRYRGFIAGRVSSGGLFTTSANTLNNGRTALTSGQNTITTNDHTVSINVNADFGGYSYTAWGRWNGADASGVLPVYASSTLEKGHWVMGRVTTPAELNARIARNDARSGGATYSGRLAGTSFNGDTIGGTVTLNANFVNSRISGNLSFTHNSSAWVNGALNSSNIITNSEGIGYNGNISLSGGGAGHMSGILYGPNAEETGGEWAIWNVPDSIGGADGVFRAREQ